MKYVLILVFAIGCMPFLWSNSIAEEQASTKATIETERKGNDTDATKPVDKNKDNSQTEEEEEEPDCED
ncbi:MAG: hypothetical protein OQK73_12740 [Gammaproteobacteria bacterium]|nr:hypothetical protein [Gammaproteobacteria bacterium]